VVDVGGVMGGEGTQAMFYHSFNTRTFGFEVGLTRDKPLRVSK
jgi:hypothetical protein